MRRRIVQYDSEESSESDADSPDSDNRVNSTTNKRKPVQKRKRGRPPGAKNKKKRIQDDSEDEDSSPQPSTSQNVNNQSSAEEESESENASDSSNDISTNRKAVAPKRKRGRPPVNKNNKRQQIDSDDDASPRPSTSQVQDSVNDYVSGSESESESADSDYGPVRDKSPAKKKPVATNQKKQPPPRTSSSPKKKSKNSVNGNSRVSQSNDVSFDPILVDNLAQKLTNFLQIEDQKKYAIRRKAIVTNVFKDEAYTPKLYTAVIKKANLILKKTFGMELMELENQKDSYLIVNILRRELGMHDYVELSRIKQQQHGLITFLLTVIYMNENVITEDELTRCLKPLGIDLTSKRLHPVFGDVKKYITTELVKQMYLNYECISKEPPKYEFTWGLRAKQEFDKRDLLQFACQIMDDTAPEDWRIQFKDAEASAKPNAASGSS